MANQSLIKGEAPFQEQLELIPLSCRLAVLAVARDKGKTKLANDVIICSNHEGEGMSH